MTEDILSLPPEKAEASLQSKGFSDGRLALKNLRLLSDGPFNALIEKIVRLAALCPSPDASLNNLEGIVKERSGEVLSSFLEDPENLGRLITISGASHFLSNILSREGLFEWLFIEGGLRQRKSIRLFREELKDRAEKAETADEMARTLRLYKQREFLRIGSRDLLGLADVKEVTEELSDLASAALDEAHDFSLKDLKKRFGSPFYTGEDGAVKEAEFAVIGLGKLGGGELNFSSDIDIIYIYSSDKGETAGLEGREDKTRISLHDFFVKHSVAVTKLLSAVTADGFVFRIDLDLRPEGRSGDVANSLRSAEVYYESWGKPWERAAMIKARAVAGSPGLGEDFLEMIRPFVYRRHLDFTSIEEIKSMKEKIDLSLLRTRPDEVDVKLGGGGIREIEFFCQALELIHGGKEKDLRERNTLRAIEKLRQRGFIKDAEAKGLREGYVFLRSLEHRIQIVEGRQSQAIPAKPLELARLARMMGFRDAPDKRAGDLFWDEYRKKTALVHDIYRTLFYKETSFKDVPEDILILLSPDISEDEALKRLGSLGFRDAKAAYKNMALLRGGEPSLRLSSRAQLLLQKLSPAFLLKASGAPDPDRALEYLERFISAIGARTAFYSLLAENPAALDELIKLFGTSVFLSRSIIEHPENLDILLSKELAIPYKRKEELSGAFLKETLDPMKDYEERLDTLRRLRNQEIMRVGINDIAGALTGRRISFQISFLAEACIEAAYRVSLEELGRLYGSPKGARFAVIGLGKLGARELIYGSDLDIVFVYEDAEGAEEARTDGPKAISNHEFFVKLGQRIISVLTLRTKEGALFSVDTRLRPSGSSGPLVVSLPSLLKYHRGKTMVWERQALTKARAVGGDEPFGKEVVKGLDEILYGKPFTVEDVGEMLRIRKRMETEIAKEGPARFNIKTGRGAIVDIEFLTQALQLKHGPSIKSLKTPETLKALSRMRKEGVLTPEDYKALKEAYSFYRLLEMKQRIVHDRPEGVIQKGSEELTALAKRAGYTGAGAGEELLSEYMARSEKVREIYLKTLEGLA